MNKILSLLIAVLGIAISLSGLLLKSSGVPRGLTLAMFLGGAMLTIGTLIFYGVSSTKKRNVDTQRIITDIDLLRLFEKQPGGILSPALIIEKTGLSKAEASSRLNSLSTGGLLIAGMSPSGMKAYFELSAPLETVEGLQLSGEPYLTIEDVQKIFVAYDYKVSPHDIMVATSLPWAIISREMQHFNKQKVIETAYIARPGDSAIQYILMEAYHPSDKLDLDSRNRINAEVKQVLYDEQFLV